MTIEQQLADLACTRTDLSADEQRALVVAHDVLRGSLNVTIVGDALRERAAEGKPLTDDWLAAAVYASEPFAHGGHISAAEVAAAVERWRAERGAT